MRGASIPTKAKLTYFQDKSLTLQLQYKSEDTWTDCFSLDATDNQPLRMPNTAYLGFSAETGELSDNFDIISVNTKNLYNPTGSRGRSPESRAGTPGRGRPAEKKSAGWGRFFFRLFLFLLVAGGAYMGFTMYRANKHHRF